MPIPPKRPTVVAPGGWFRTGDLATVDDDGWLTIVGRLKDVIIRGGENISSSEVEAVLEAHPSVRHAVAVGYPDPLMGERVAAFVESSEPFDLEECRSWFERRGVAKFKTPEKVERLERLPLLGSGKADRAALRARAATESSLQPHCSRLIDLPHDSATGHAVRFVSGAPHDEVPRLEPLQKGGRVVRPPPLCPVSRTR